MSKTLKAAVGGFAAGIAVYGIGADIFGLGTTTLSQIIVSLICSFTAVFVTLRD